MSLISNKPLNELSKWWSVVCVVCNIITIIILLFVCKIQKTTYGNYINYIKGKTKISSVILITIAMLVIGMGGMYFAGFICYHKIPYMAIMMIQPLPLCIAIANILILPLSTTLAEDGLYLGSLQIGEKHVNVFLVAFFYALQHSFIPLLPDIKFILYRLLSFLPLTIIMCYWYRKNKNPLPLMIGHFIINLATVVQIVMTSASPILFEQLKSMS